MKANNEIPGLAVASPKFASVPVNSISKRGTKRASLIEALLVLVLFVFVAGPAAQAADLFNNFNSAGVLSGPPQSFTLFTLSQPAQITELETYHWFNGVGTPTSVGNIGIWNVSPAGTPTTMVRAFAARGVAASFGVIADWVADTNCANPGCFLPAGTYAIEDSSLSTWSFNSASGSHGFAVVRGTSVAAIPAGAFVLTGAPAPPPPVVSPGGAILFTNMNTQGVATGVAPNVGTLFTLKTQSSAVQYVISEISTYHFNGGAGAAPGVISIWTTSRQLLFAGNAQGTPGQGGGIDNWVVNVNPPLKLLPGTYILDDSGHTSWSHNGGSAGCLPFNVSFQCGMGTIFGTMVPFVPQNVRSFQPPQQIQSLGFPQTCDHNSGAVAFILNPCTGAPRAGDTVTVQTNRALPMFTAILFSFQSCQFCGLPPAPLTAFAIPAAFTGGGTVAGSQYTVTVPPGVCGGAAGNTFNASVWDVVPMIGGTPQGIIGRYVPDCR